VKRYVEVGALAKNDQLKAELNLAQAQQLEIQAEAGVFLSEGVLATLVGLPPGTHIEPTDTYSQDIPPIPVSMDEATKAGLSGRPEISQIDDQAKMSSLLRDASRGGYLPTLSLIGNAQYSSGSTLQGGVIVFAGLNLSWTVWDWGLVRDQVAAASAAVDQAQ